MSSIIIASIPAHGHITPLLTVAENFVKRGDYVRFVTGSRYADKVAATGATFVPLPAEADFDDQNCPATLSRARKVEGHQSDRLRHRTTSLPGPLRRNTRR